jgi:membrane associated rhomboid family serine protease
MLPVYRTPVLTYALIAVMFGFWLLSAALGSTWALQQIGLPPLLVLLLATPDLNTLLLLGAKYGPPIYDGQYWRLVTAVFLHAGVLHLAVNMWALLQLGSFCEILYGRKRFLILFICSGAMGTYASYLLSPAPGVGASGAIFGLLGAAFVYSLKYRSELPQGMADQMRRSLTPVLLINLAITFALPIVDKWAHLGGLISGALIAALAESCQAPDQRREREGLPVPAALLTSVGLLLYAGWGLMGTFPAASAVHTARMAAKRGQTDAALQTLRQTAAQGSTDALSRLHLYTLLLQILVEQKRWSEAQSEFLVLSRTPLPREGILLVGGGLAVQLSLSRRGTEAESVYRRLLELVPGDPALLNGLAYLYADVLETNLDEAEQMVHRALDLSPNEGAFVDTLAWVYFKQGKLEQAYQTQRRAVKLAENNPEVRYHMGVIEAARGQLAAARHQYEEALRLDPKFAPAREALRKLRERRTPPPRPVPSQEEVAAAS